MKPATLLALILPLILVGACEPAGKILGIPEHTPSIHRIEPNFGSTEGGETIIILGDDFGEDPDVSFGGAPAQSVERKSSGELLVKTPDSGVEGSVEVTVTNRGGKECRLPDAYTYQDPLLSPRIDAVDPANGFMGGGTPVTIKGANFQDGIAVYFHGAPADQVVFVDGETITAKTPSVPEGFVDVLVMNNDGRRSVLLLGFQATGLTNDEHQVFLLVNQERAMEGLEPLALNGILIQAARNHSQDMIDRDFFDHINPDGLAPWDRATELGYPSSFVGENIAAGYATPQSVMDGWMNSPGHRANILNPNFKEIGIGRKEGGSMSIYWTQVFGTP